MPNPTHLRRLLPWLLLIALLLGCLSAGAVTFTEDGGMIVNGEGTDDFSVVEGTDSSYGYESIVTPPPVSEEERGPGPTFAKSDKLDFYLILDDGSMEAVELISAGSVNSTVKVGGETLYVDTCHLVYDIGDVQDDQRFAIINAQKNGYATMHLKANVKSAVVGRFMTNRVCLVLDVGKKYTKVWVDDAMGYILTSSLTFLEGHAEDTYLAKMSFNGKVKSANSINIHMNGKNRSRILDAIRCGTQLTVFSVSDDGWTEIEASGWHGWVLSKYVTYDELEIAQQ